MKNLLFGNGLNINFSGTQFTNKSIIIRSIANVKGNKNPREAYPKEVLDWLKLLYKEYENTKDGINDNYVISSFEKKALIDFKKRYKNINNPKIYEIGFEDYFLIHDIFCYKNKIINPERFMFREVLKRMFLYSIYFNGKILKIKDKFSEKLLDYFNEFDKLFTTNYDNNVEEKCKKKVYYLHGAFHILDDTYNPNSFRNQLSDTKEKKFEYTKKHKYLFSNALSTFSGDIKEQMMHQPELANSAIEKFAEGYKKDENVRKDIDQWKNDENEIVRNMYEAIMFKIKGKKYDEYLFTKYYPLKEFSEIEGELVILGLSPFNDTHIFSWIKNNKKLNSIIYLYCDRSEVQIVDDLLDNKRAIHKSIKEFWENIGT